MTHLASCDGFVVVFIATLKTNPSASIMGLVISWGKAGPNAVTITILYYQCYSVICQLVGGPSWGGNPQHSSPLPPAASPGMDRPRSKPDGTDHPRCHCLLRDGVWWSRRTIGDVGTTWSVDPRHISYYAGSVSNCDR